MNISELPPREYLLERLIYNSGKLYWKTHPHTRRIGAQAGTPKPNGYRKLTLDSKCYLEHRIIYQLHYGDLSPHFEIDHIDGNKSNNYIHNLRKSTSSENSHNTSIIRASSGAKGVYWSKQNKKWIAQITVRGNYIYCGGHDDKELAELVVQEARRKYHKEFANNGKPPR